MNIHFSANARSVHIIVMTLILFFFSPLFSITPVYAAVVINELYPKTEPATGEWIELFNNGPDAVSLDRWKLQNSEGDVHTFIFNASAIIPAHGYVTFPGSQTNIVFSVSGDTVKLFDEKNTQVDIQSFPSILGYNTSMGRSTDGSGVWTLCTIPTYNKANTCPAPSPMPTNPSTPTPTFFPTNTPIPTPTPLRSEPTSASDRRTFGSLLPSPTQPSVPRGSEATSPTPIPDSTSLTLKLDKIIALKILFAAVAWIIFIIVAGMFYLRHKKKPH